MKNVKYIVIAICILSMVSGCVLFSKNNSSGNAGKKDNPVSGGKK